MKRIIIVAAAMVLAVPSIAQVNRRATTNAASTISVTNTFQSVFAANNYRYGCTIQNTGSNTMWVFFGPIASATKAKSVVLPANGSATCNSAGVTLTDQVSITGTSADTFYAGEQ